jgi:phage shock protein C
MSRRLVRRRDHAVIAGVCGALAEGFGLSPTLVRLGFVLFGLFGVGEIVYLVLWVLLPKQR